MSRTIFNKIPLTHYEYCKEVYNQIFDVPNNSNIFDEINNLIPKNDEPNFGKVLDETIRKTWREMEPAFVIKQKFAQQIYHHVWFERSGKHVYRPSEAIIKILLNTDISKIDAKYFILPYDSVYISLPPIFQIFNNITQKQQKVDGVFVTISDYSRGDMFDSIACVWTPETNLSKDFVKIEGRREIDFQICGRTESEDEKGLESLRHVRLVVNDDTSMQDVLKFNFAISDEVYKNDPEGYAELDKVDKPIIRLIVNLMLYVTCGSKDALKLITSRFEEQVSLIEKKLVGKMKIDRKSRRELQRLNQKYRQFSKLPFYLVGAEVTPSGSISRRDLIGGIAPHDVSKHWKMQVFGPGRKQRKLILIDSYHRGAVMEKETV